MMDVEAKDYYKVFLIDQMNQTDSDLQITDMENRFCNCVNNNYVNNIYIRLYSCWERALEYLYRAPVKNYGKDLIRDLVKAKTECETICKLLDKIEDKKQKDLFNLVPDFMREQISKVNTIEELRDFSSKYGYFKYPLLYPLILNLTIDFKHRYNYIAEKYGFKLSYSIQKELCDLFLLFLTCNNYDDLLSFINNLNLTIQRYSNLEIKIDFTELNLVNLDAIIICRVIEKTIIDLFGDLVKTVISITILENNKFSIVINLKKFNQTEIFKSYSIELFKEEMLDQLLILRDFSL